MKSWTQHCFNVAAAIAIMVSLVHYLNDEVERTIGPIHCATDRIAVYSDVDDTLQCSHEHNGAGVDTQLPSKTIYPGAVAFELALSRGVNNEPALPVVLLSARPRVLKWLLGIGADHPIARSFRKHDARFARRYFSTMRGSRSTSEPDAIEPEVTRDANSGTPSKNSTNATEQVSGAPPEAPFLDALPVEDAKRNEGMGSSGSSFSGRSDTNSLKRRKLEHNDSASIDAVNGSNSDQELYDFLLTVSESDNSEESTSKQAEPHSSSMESNSGDQSQMKSNAEIRGSFSGQSASAVHANNGEVSNGNLDEYVSELGATCQWIPIPLASQKNIKSRKMHASKLVVRNETLDTKVATNERGPPNESSSVPVGKKPACLESCNEGSEATSRSSSSKDLAELETTVLRQNHDGRWKVDQGFLQDPYGACPWVDALTGLPGAEAVGSLAVLEWPPVMVPPTFFNQDWVDASQQLVAWAEWQLASGGFRSRGHSNKYARGSTSGDGHDQHNDDDDHGSDEGDSALFRYLPLQPLAPLTVTLNLGSNRHHQGLSTGIEALEPLVKLWAHAQGFPESARGLLGLSASSSSGSTGLVVGRSGEGNDGVVFIDNDLDSGDEHSNDDDGDGDSSKGMVGIDVERNLYGNLHDFFHDTRARYVAIGRTKLANIIASEGTSENEDENGSNARPADDAMNNGVPETEGSASTPVDETAPTACGKGCNTNLDYNSSSSSSAKRQRRYRNRARAMKQQQCLAFVGDSGQGDELVARGLLGDPGSYDDPVPPRALLNRVAAAFIHDIDAPRNDLFTDRFMPPGLDLGNSRSSRARPLGTNLARYHRFTSYAGAALAAFKSCRVSLEGLEDVVIAVEESAEYRACAALANANNQTQAASSPCGKGSGDQCCHRLLHGVKEARDAVLGYSRGVDHFGSIYSNPAASSNRAGSKQGHHSLSHSGGSSSSNGSAFNGSGGSSSSAYSTIANKVNIFGPESTSSLHHHEPSSRSCSLIGLFLEIPWHRVLARHGTKAKCSGLRAWGQVAATVSETTEATLVRASFAALDWVPPPSYATTYEESGAAAAAAEPMESATSAAATATPEEAAAAETALESSLASKLYAEAPVPSEASFVPASPDSKSSDSTAAKSEIGSPHSSFTMPGTSLSLCLRDAARKLLGLVCLRVCWTGSVVGHTLLAAIPEGTREYVRSAAEQYLGGLDENTL